MTMFTPQETKDLSKLLSYAANKDEVLSLDGLHGFLFGLAIIPERVLPREWLSCVVGQEMQNVDDEKEGKRLLESLFSAHIRIAKQNQDGALAFPFDIDSIESTGIQRFRDWTQGLFLAICLRPKVWGATGKFDKSKENESIIATSVAIIMGIVFPKDIPKLFPPKMAKIAHLGNNPAEIEAKLFTMLPTATASILEYANASRARLKSLGTGKLSGSPESYRTVKIGRNDPCPCGSGVKYKKCCGK